MSLIKNLLIDEIETVLNSHKLSFPRVVYEEYKRRCEERSRDLVDFRDEWENVQPSTIFDIVDEVEYESEEVENLMEIHGEKMCNIFYEYYTNK